MNLSPENLTIMARISHEIRNPINAIIGIAHLLQHEDEKESQEELLQTLLQISESLLELTNNVLDFTKLESGETPRHISAVNLRKEIPVGLFGHLTLAKSKGLDLIIKVDDNVPKLVLFDRVRGMQIMVNLVSNALKFTQEGRVTVEVKTVNLQHDRATLRFSVKDTGMGIPEGSQQKIFEPFTQGTSSIGLTHGGTGLGLSIVNRLLTMVGGELKLKSKPGEGSEFYFEVTLGIPLEEDSAPFKEEAVEPRDILGDRKVLLVDDNEINLLVARKTFENWKIDFRLVRNGAEALEIVQQEDFAAVLMDLHMPIMDGYEATCAIRNLPDDKFLDLPIIALSGSTGISRAEEVKAAGFTEFLGKPYTPQDLLQKLADVIKVEETLI